MTAAMAILNHEEILLAQSIINKTAAGIYELRELYGPDWSKITSPTSFGAKFKKAVNSGHLQRIRENSLKTNNHYTYEIY